MLDALLDLAHGAECVACRTPGRLLCRPCARALPSGGEPVAPDPCPPGLAPSYAAGPYADALKSLILAHKERHAFALAKPLGRVLAAVIETQVAGPDLLLVPVPSRPSVVRDRGHDPMLRVVRAAAARLRGRGVEVRTARLLRQRLTPADQAGLGATARRDNLRDSLVVAASARAALVRQRTPTRIVICDDILTTGATAREAQRALQDSGLTVIAVACVAATQRWAAG